MKLLRFDPAGAINSDFGVTTEQLQALYPRLIQLRQEMIEVAPTTTSAESGLAEKPSLDARFYRLPQDLLEEYTRRREASELGRIFKVANSLDNDVDAVVVLGIGNAYLGARAMMDACCDPYHNELRRAGRGSKPRMYFEGNDVDNDASQALLSRLAAGGYGDTAPEQRHAIVVIIKNDESLETAVAFRQFLASLRLSLGTDADKWLPRLVIPVTDTGSQLDELAKAIGCEEIFSVANRVGGRFSLLSAVGLLPAAFLGLDCMRLLEGAVAMNQHFETAVPAENVVLRYVAVNHLLAQNRQKTTRVLSVWSKELEAVGWWYDQLLAESLGKQGKGVTPLTTVNTRDLHSRHQQHQQGANDKVFNNLIVEKQRTDPLAVGSSPWNHDALNDLAEKDLADIMTATIDATNESLHADGRPTTNLILPVIDTHVLGQLFQMLMIATVLEGRLIGVNPYDQPGVVRYKINRDKNLGRN